MIVKTKQSTKLVKFDQSYTKTRCVAIVYAKWYKQRNNKQSNCCCIDKVVNSGTQNCANNKETQINVYSIYNLRAYILKVFKT